jgi:hypothetical protein
MRWVEADLASHVRISGLARNRGDVKLFYYSQMVLFYFRFARPLWTPRGCQFRINRTPTDYSHPTRRINFRTDPFSTLHADACTLRCLREPAISDPPARSHFRRAGNLQCVRAADDTVTVVPNGITGRNTAFVGLA